MQENLVIVESPAKARTIEKFLGSDFHVASSFGHIRDLAKKNLGIDIANKFKPHYVISEEKKKVVNELKKLTERARSVWLASDEDREGEAIAWHLAEVLNLDREKTKRIVFHEITKEAIMEAIKSPRSIDLNLVNAQQARRILDRLVGFELSPILWKKIQPALSAGRVQSVAVRLLVEREREINNFRSTPSYRVTAVFTFPDNDGRLNRFNAELSKRFQTHNEAMDFLKQCIGAHFAAVNTETKPSKRSPSPPFTTSTLQQEASRKLGFSVSQTMTIAQKLYEAGKITYMRTDSVNLSNLALATIKKVVINEYGENYSRTRQYQTKSKGAQEAHEAIRPTYPEQDTITGSQQEKKLYDLIWKRTIASQMSEALLEKTIITISISTRKELFTATGEVLRFDGFLKVYKESTDENGEETTSLLPPVPIGQILSAAQIQAVQRFTQQPPRYTEALLVKKLEELGIGRPSTYAPIISTIQQRGYVTKEDIHGTTRTYQVITLADNTIREEKKTEMTGFEKAKLVPNDIGMIVNDFLVEHFAEILNYNFTASVEEQFDEIAEGKLEWTTMIERFYQSFHEKVQNTLSQTSKETGERLLGHHPETGEPVLVKMGPYGPMVQVGESKGDQKPRFASLLKKQRIETITLDEALNLFKLPRVLGTYENQEVLVNIGKFGPYVRHESKFYSMKRNQDDPWSVDLTRAIEIIEEKRKTEREKVIKTFAEDTGLQVLNGRWGPYIRHGDQNYKIPRGQNPAELSYEECLNIMAAPKKTVKRTRKK